MKKSQEKAIIGKTLDYARKTLEGESSGHDWWHVYRVYQYAVTIGKTEKADLFVVGAAAILHDIADYKLHGGDTEIGPRTASEWLKKQGVEAERIEHVASIIRGLSFKGANVRSDMPTIEGKIVQDADRLEAIGAMGVARAFSFGGHKGMVIFNPDILPANHKDFAAYKNKENGAPTVNHFYEKLLLVKDLMNTKAAKKMAARRHKYLVNFLKEFFMETEQAGVPLAKWRKPNKLLRA